MSEINKKPLIFEKFREFSKQYPEYSVGEMLHSVITNASTAIKLDSKGDLLDITDEQIYSGIDGAINNETKENPIEDGEY
jgi:hypothetical protein